MPIDAIIVSPFSFASKSSSLICSEAKTPPPPESTLKTMAIVLRVDSGGGGVFASEQIRLELLEAKEKGLTIIASMGNVAASGGYWISANALAEIQ